MDQSDIKAIADRAAALAEAWQQQADALIGRRESAFQAQMAGLLRQPMDKMVLTRMIDQGFRSDASRRVADQIIHTMESRSIPAFFSASRKAVIRTWTVWLS